MNRKYAHRTGPVLLALATLLIIGCDTTSKPNATAKAKNDVERTANSRQPYLPKNNVEFNNYNEAQKLYDSPDTIIWCSTTWGNASAPIVTIPIAGKLTSSSTTYFRPEEFIDRGNYSWQTGSARSVDGMFHPNPPQYRYGFTPGGQYVDFFNMPTVCTTALTKFQREQTKVSLRVDAQTKAAQRQAEEALRRGDKAGAQAALEGAIGG